MTEALPVTSKRDARIDVFRGLALITIFIDHVRENFYANYTLGNFGWSDAAEGFVLMSGMSAGLAYGLYFRPTMRFMVGLGRVLRRVWTIYLVHILVTVMALAVTAAIALWFDNPAIMQRNQMSILFGNPKQFVMGIPILTEQLDYGDILPLYLVLLLTAPIGLILAWRWPFYLLVGSAVGWLAVVHFRFNLPNWSSPEGWYFNPLAWQLIYTIGLLTGVAMKDGRRLIPVRLWLQILCGAILVFGLAWMQWPAFGDQMYDLQAKAVQAGYPPYLISFEKTFLPLPRLVHCLALTYLLSSFGWVERASNTAVAAPFAMIGRQALPVFALGSVIVYAVQAIKVETGTNFWLDSLMIGGGIVAMLALACARQFWPKDNRTKTDMASSG